MPAKTNVAQAVYKIPAIFKMLKLQEVRNLITIVQMRNDADFQNK